MHFQWVPLIFTLAQAAVAGGMFEVGHHTRRPTTEGDTFFSTWIIVINCYTASTEYFQNLSQRGWDSMFRVPPSLGNDSLMFIEAHNKRTCSEQNEQNNSDDESETKKT